MDVWAPIDRRDGSSDTRLILDSFRRLVRALRIFDRQAERKAGLSAAQLFVLHRLAAARALSLNDLARRTHTDQSSVSVAVDRLVKRGLVRRSRSARDGRRIELAVTAAGRRRLASAPPAAQDRLIHALRRLPPRDRKNLARLMARVVQSTGIHREKPSLFLEEGR